MTTAETKDNKVQERRNLDKIVNEDDIKKTLMENNLDLIKK